jgi:peptidyl-prolyl cis-trans isomerase B (cyclophilin B)
MSNRKTRDRQLRKLHERRIMQRRRQRRQRSITMIIASVLVVGLAVGLVLVLANRGKQSSATSSSAPPASASPTASTVACGGTVPAAASQKKATYQKPPEMTIDPNKTYTATMVTSCGKIVMKLDPKQSPNTVNSFVFLARQRFFDGLIFHRISKDFVIQGGDPTGTGTSGPGYSTVDTPPKGATYPIGTVAMAKSGSEPAGTAGSQFFIVTGKNGASLTPDYAIIGKVTAGQDVAKTIEGLPIEGGATDGKPVSRPREAARSAIRIRTARLTNRRSRRSPAGGRRSARGVSRRRYRPIPPGLPHGRPT